MFSKYRVPFDDSTAIGYTICYIVQLSGSASICAIIYTVNSLFFGVCWYVRTLLFDLHSIFVQINELFATENYDAKTILKSRVFLRKYVQTHNNIIRYAVLYQYKTFRKYSHSNKFFIRFVEHFGEIMSGIIFVTFFISILWICTSFFQIHVVSFSPLSLILNVSFSWMVIFFYCFIYDFYSSILYICRTCYCKV